ncbi:MAG TPA: chorismate mutase [Clostridia bacterium]|nr:chorismate mutase [Clostridia bacterium]
MRIYGIRGATTVEANTSEAILKETKHLLRALLEANNLQTKDLVSIIFTTTPDLTAEFPAKAARLMGLNKVPLLGAVEANVSHGLPLCIRLLLHAYLKTDTKVCHLYLNRAVDLRSDL